MLERYSQAHQAFMTRQISVLNPVYQHRIGLIQRVFESHYSPADALQRAHAMVYDSVLQQASYWAFVQLFYQITWACAFCFVAVMFLRRVKAPRPVLAH